LLFENTPPIEVLQAAVVAAPPIEPFNCTVSFSHKGLYVPVFAVASVLKLVVKVSETTVQGAKGASDVNVNVIVPIKSKGGV
jgi:hypothetical protein